MFCITFIRISLTDLWVKGAEMCACVDTWRCKPSEQGAGCGIQWARPLSLAWGHRQLPMWSDVDAAPTVGEANGFLPGWPWPRSSRHWVPQDCKALLSHLELLSHGPHCHARKAYGSHWGIKQRHLLLVRQLGQIEPQMSSTATRKTIVLPWACAVHFVRWRARSVDFLSPVTVSSLMCMLSSLIGSTW